MRSHSTGSLEVQDPRIRVTFDCHRQFSRTFALADDINDDAGGYVWSRLAVDSVCSGEPRDIRRAEGYFCSSSCEVFQRGVGGAVTESITRVNTLAALDAERSDLANGEGGRVPELVTVYDVGKQDTTLTIRFNLTVLETASCEQDHRRAQPRLSSRSRFFVHVSRRPWLEIQPDFRPMLLVLPRPSSPGSADFDVGGAEPIHPRITPGSAQRSRSGTQIVIERAAGEANPASEEAGFNCDKRARTGGRDRAPPTRPAAREATSLYGKQAILRW